MKIHQISLICKSLHTWTNMTSHIWFYVTKFIKECAIAIYAQKESLKTPSLEKLPSWSFPMRQPHLDELHYHCHQTQTLCWWKLHNQLHFSERTTQTFIEKKKTISEKYRKEFLTKFYSCIIQELYLFSSSLSVTGYEACQSAKIPLLLVVIRDNSSKPLQYEITDIREVDYFEYWHKAWFIICIFINLSLHIILISSIYSNFRMCQKSWRHGWMCSDWMVNTYTEQYLTIRLALEMWCFITPPPIISIPVFAAFTAIVFKRRRSVVRKIHLKYNFI